MCKFRSAIRKLLYRVSPASAFFIHTSLYWLRKVEPEIRLLPMLCEPDAMALDVGAHYGIYSYFMARHSRQVIAFEPNSALASRLACMGGNIQVKHLALSDKAGDAHLTIPMLGTMQQTALASIQHDHRQVGMEVVVSRARLDELDLGSMCIGFIKIDVEGHELCVLQGCTGVLMRDQPTLLVEAEDRHRANAVGSIRDFLTTFGYQGFFLCQSRLYPIEIFSVTAHQRIPTERPMPYINNFIFIARAEVKARLARYMA